MEKLDKVIAGLTSCIESDCRNCVYNGRRCTVRLMQDALVVIGALRISATVAETHEKGGEQ